MNYDFGEQQEHLVFAIAKYRHSNEQYNKSKAKWTIYKSQYHSS